MSDDVQFKECYYPIINDFTTYDQAVDVVSAWEAIIRYSYSEILSYFDRFPKISFSGLTPDFTVTFNNSYGIIFEMKRSFPEDDIGFIKELKQLKKYDSDLPLKNDSSGGTIVPSRCDIVLLISSNQSNHIFKRINKLLKKEGISFNKNLIFIEYSYNQIDTHSRYIFKKFMGENGKFQDEFNPIENSFEHILGDEAKSFECLTKFLVDFKVAELICNDPPPNLYLAVILWTKIFMYYLDAG